VTENLNSPAWVRSTIEGDQCIFLSDRTLYSETHRAHSFRNRGLVIGETSPDDRYFVACLAVAGVTINPCEVCDEPAALIKGPGAAVVLYSGNDYEAAVAAYDDWFN
jgi:hypothetical protein